MRETTVAARFQQQVQLSPDNVAVRKDGQSVTYSELEAAASRIAGALGQGDFRDSPVAILMDDGPLLIASMFAVLKTGRAFIPLEAKLPEARLAAVITASGTSQILSDGTHLAKATGIAGTDVEVILAEALRPAAPVAGFMPVPSNSVACVVYTSGSTGKPKGVAISHAQLVHSIDARTRLGDIRPTDRYAHVRASGSSASLNTILVPLLNGAASCIFDLHRHGLQKLGPWMVAEQITGIHLTSSLLRTWMKSLPEDFRIPSLRLIIPGSEPLYGVDVSLTAGHLVGDWRIVVHLSSTETGFLTGRVIGPKDALEPGILHVGPPVPGKEISIVPEPDAQSERVGEIVVRSRFISPGYWNEPALTAAAFSTDPSDEHVRTFRTGDLGRWRADGSLEHLGRKNRKIKLRGYSVEPYEIETALLHIEGVRDAAVVGVGDENDRHLVAYLVADKGTKRTPAEIRKHLSTTLPDYMMPRHVVVLDAFPLTTRGKVDLKALPVPDEQTTRGKIYRAPQTEQERVLASIWQEVLQNAPIGADDDFYELGGTSLQAFLIFARIANVLGHDLPPATMLQAATIATQAELLHNAKPHARDKLVPFRRSGGGLPLFVVHGAFGDIMFTREIVRDLKSDRPVYGLQPVPLDGAHRLPRSMETIAAEYLAEIRKVQSNGPYFLAGYSFGGMAALEMAQQLARAGQPVAFVGLIDTIYDGRYQVAGESTAARAGRHWNEIRGRHAAVYVANRLAKTLGHFARNVREGLGEIPNELRYQLGRPIPYETRAPFYRLIFSRATQRYRPQSYGGALTVFSAQGRTEWHRARWREIAGGGLTVHEIPANHFDLVWPPHSTLLAEYFDAGLDSAAV